MSDRVFVHWYVSHWHSRSVFQVSSIPALMALVWACETGTVVVIKRYKECAPKWKRARIVELKSSSYTLHTRYRLFMIFNACAFRVMP